MTRPRPTLTLLSPPSLAALALVAGLALGWVAPGCAGGAVEALVGMCEADDDCADGRVCDFSHCVAPGLNRAVLQARVVPPANAELPPQQIPALTFDEGPDRLIRLVEPAIVRGVVRPRDDSFTVNVPGELEVTTPGEIS